MDTTELIREFEGKQVGPWCPDDFIGPKFFSVSFLDGLVVRKYFALTYTEELSLMGGAEDCFRLA